MMIRPIALGCVLCALPIAAAAQEPWQDQAYTHSYDAYFACYRAVIGDGTQVDRNDQQAIEALFHRAYTQCASERSAGTAAAEARLAELRPDYSSEDRRSVVSIFRRGLVVLGLRPHLQQLGLGPAFSQYFERTLEF